MHTRCGARGRYGDPLVYSSPHILLVIDDSASSLNKSLDLKEKLLQTSVNQNILISSLFWMYESLSVCSHYWKASFQKAWPCHYILHYSENMIYILILDVITQM